MNPILAQALFLSRMGIAVHWLRPPEGGDPEGRGKAPIQKGWQGIPYQSPAQLERTYKAGFNLGLRTGRVMGAKLCLIGVDCDSIEATRLCARKLPLPGVRTRTRQGFHLLYRHPGGAIALGNRVKVDGVAIDLRADLGNLVLPPSVHPEGHVYEARGDWSETGFASLPLFDPSWFPPPPPPPPTRATSARTPTISEARLALAKLRPSVSGGDGGEPRLWTAALTLATRFGLGEDDIVALLHSDFNPRCEKPWSERVLRHKAREAMKSRAACAARSQS